MARFEQSDVTSGYRKDIDGLRALAIGLVVIFHFDLFPIGEAGFIGVDIFFVISGFLITRIIVEGLEDGRFRLGEFFYRRIRRLYPAMLATLFLFLLAGYFLLLPDMFEELGRETILSQLYVVNFYFWRSINYFGLQADNVPLLHMWSLAVEEQFYLIFPICMMALYRWARGVLIWIMAAVTLISFGLGWFASGWKPEAAFYLLPTRAWELLVGGLIATALHRGWRPSAGICQVTGPLGLAVIGFALWYYGPGVQFPGWFAILPVLGAAGLLIGGLASQTPVSRMMALAPMVFLGRVSYPLYLVHWPVIILMQDGVESYDWGWRAAGLVLSILLAWGIYRFVEYPLRHGRLLPRPRTFLIAAFSCTGLLVMMSAWSVQTNGVPGRYDPQVLQLLAYREDAPRAFDSCTLKAKNPEPFCQIGQDDAPMRVVIVGDSHSKALAGAMDIWLRSRQEKGGFAFSSACMPVLGTGGERCRRFAEGFVSAIEADPDIERVYLVSIWRQVGGKNFQVDGEIVPGARGYEAFERALSATTVRLTTAGKTVILVDPLFAAPHDVPQTLAKNLAFGRSWPTDHPLAQHQKEFARLHGVFDAVVGLGAQQISLIDELCETGICKSIWQDRPVFTDNNHLAFGLSSYFARVLEREHQRMLNTSK